VIVQPVWLTFIKGYWTYNLTKCIMTTFSCSNILSLFIILYEVSLNRNPGLKKSVKQTR